MSKVKNADEAFKELTRLFGKGTPFDLSELQVMDLLRRAVGFHERNKELREFIEKQLKDYETFNNKEI